MNTASRVQTLDEAVGISHIANTFGKGMNPILLLQGAEAKYGDNFERFFFSIISPNFEKQKQKQNEQKTR